MPHNVKVGFFALLPVINYTRSQIEGQSNDDLDQSLLVELYMLLYSHLRLRYMYERAMRIQVLTTVRQCG